MDIRSLFDAFYDRLVLRDLFGKMVPGILLVGSVFSSFFGLDKLDHLQNTISAMLWFVVAGFSWLVGFALQYVGEACHMLRTHPPGLNGKETRDTFYAKWARFHEVAKPHEVIHAERLIIIKEACGNAAVSLTLAILMAIAGLVLRRTTSWYQSLPLAITALGLAVALWRMHVIHVLRYGRFVEHTNSHRKHKSENNSPSVSA